MKRATSPKTRRRKAASITWAGAVPHDGVQLQRVVDVLRAGLGQTNFGRALAMTKALDMLAELGIHPSPKARATPRRQPVPRSSHPDPHVRSEAPAKSSSPTRLPGLLRRASMGGAAQAQLSAGVALLSKMLKRTGTSRPKNRRSRRGLGST